MLVDILLKRISGKQASNFRIIILMIIIKTVILISEKVKSKAIVFAMHESLRNSFLCSLGKVATEGRTNIVSIWILNRVMIWKIQRFDKNG